MPFDRIFLDELSARNDIVEIVSQYVQLKKSGANYFGLCPFHNEKTGSFSVSPDKQIFYCFGCHAGGDAITFVRMAENLDYVDAVEFLANRAGLQMPRGLDDRSEERGVTRKRVLEMNLEAAKFFRACLFDPELGAPGMEYLKGRRHLTDATIKHFGLGYARRGTAGRLPLREESENGTLL